MEDAMTTTAIDAFATATQRGYSPFGRRLRLFGGGFIRVYWRRCQERRMLHAVYELNHEGVLADVETARGFRRYG
jgi:hypothetical protein